MKVWTLNDNDYFTTAKQHIFYEHTDALTIVSIESDEYDEARTWRPMRVGSAAEGAGAPSMCVDTVGLRVGRGVGLKVGMGAVGTGSACIWIIGLMRLGGL